MDPIIVGYLSLGAIAIAIYAGLHVAIALAGVSLFGFGPSRVNWRWR